MSWTAPRCANHPLLQELRSAPQCVAFPSKNNVLFLKNLPRIDVSLQNTVAVLHKSVAYFGLRFVALAVRWRRSCCCHRFDSGIHLTHYKRDSPLKLIHCCSCGTLCSRVGIRTGIFKSCRLYKLNNMLSIDDWCWCLHVRCSLCGCKSLQAHAPQLHLSLKSACVQAHTNRPCF